MSKTALITGASRGIGKAIAQMLAGEGYRLYLICHKNQELLHHFAKELSATFHVDVTCFCGDISDSSFVESVFSDIKELDLLINNAGISQIGLFSELSYEQWHRVIDTNLSSVFYTCKQAIPKMLQKHAGHIINISSVWGNVGASMEVAYSASKGGVNALTRALAKELAPSGISVNAIACGVIDTDMNACFDEDEKAALIEEIPCDRFGTPTEVATLVHSIITAPSYLTGQIITLDGGWQ